MIEIKRSKNPQISNKDESDSIGIGNICSDTE